MKEATPAASGAERDPASPGAVTLMKPGKESAGLPSRSRIRRRGWTVKGSEATAEAGRRSRERRSDAGAVAAPGWVV